MARASSSATRAGLRSRCAAVAVVATGALACANLAFCAFEAPPVLERPRPQSGAAIADVEEPSGKRGAGGKPRTDSTVIALQLGSGFPYNFGPEVTQGPRWATCFVEAYEAGRISDNGVLAVRNVLEEWVVRGEREHINEFRGWRQSQGSGATVRCQSKSAVSVEDSFCLECVSHAPSAHLPFSPLGTVRVTETGNIMTFGGLDQCLVATAGMGYCKTGTVAVAI
mmetsp:Transcript_98885/g.284006  ORF Transcript_98885/g.284006 Transcript_98885/m.284006 type:complete len:225 (-) Transcript_98885:358-1032(-)